MVELLRRKESQCITMEKNVVGYKPCKEIGTSSVQREYNLPSLPL
jgi:hypothetical protein